MKNYYRCGDCVEEGRDGIIYGFKEMQRHRKQTGHAKHPYDYWRIDNKDED